MGAGGVVRCKAKWRVMAERDDPAVFVPGGTEGILMRHEGDAAIPEVTVCWDNAYPRNADHNGRREPTGPITLTTKYGTHDIEIDWASVEDADDEDDDRDLDPISPEAGEVVGRAIFGNGAKTMRVDNVVRVPAIGQRVRDRPREGVVAQVIVEPGHVVVVVREDDGRLHYTIPEFLEPVGPDPQWLFLTTTGEYLS